MVKHIVMWSFKESIKEEDKPLLKENMAKNLKSLEKKVPGLETVLFIKEPLNGTTHDMALVCEFSDEKSKVDYRLHPSHVEVANTFVRPFVCNRSCLDYQM